VSGLGQTNSSLIVSSSCIQRPAEKVALSAGCAYPYLPLRAALDDLRVLFVFSTAFPHGRNERGGELFIQREQVLDPFAVILKGLGTVAQVNCPVQLRVRLDQGGRHRQRVVKVGQRGIGRFLPLGQDRPGGPELAAQQRDRRIPTDSTS
jgi:hypothetical protein